MEGISFRAREPYLFKEFEFLTESQTHSTRTITWNEDILALFNGYKLINNFDKDCFENLLKFAEKSKVGKGRNTVRDDKTRSSMEITSDRFTVSPFLLKLIQKEINEMSLDIEHPLPIEAIPYKLILYSKGDRFDTHIDTVHRENQIMTVSLEIASKKKFRAYGGELSFKGDEIEHPEEGNLSLSLFYHDAKHKVEEIQSGYKMVLVFDVIQIQHIVSQDNILMEKYRERMEKGLYELKKRKVNRVGMYLTHTYFGEPTPPLLKGLDRIMYEFLNQHSKNIEFKEIVSTNDRDVYLRDILNIISQDSAFSALYHSVCSDESDSEDAYRTTKNLQSYDKIKIMTDNESYILKDEYLLGDVVFLESKNVETLIYGTLCGEELHLGNEGFYGKIYSNMALIAALS